MLELLDRVYDEGGAMPLIGLGMVYLAIGITAAIAVTAGVAMLAHRIDALWGVA